MSLALYCLWLLPIPFLICVAAVMYRRKQHLVYPIFWLFMCFYSVAFPTEFICKLVSYKAFFYSYWTVSFLAAIFKLLVLGDVFSHALRKYPELSRFRRITYEIAAGCLCFLAVAIVLKMAGTQSISRRIQIGELMASCVAVFVFVFVVASSAILGIKWRSAIAGIATGLGMMGTSAVLAFLILGRGAKLSQHILLASWVQSLGFNAGVGIFVFYFLPQRTEIQLPKTVRPELLEWAESMRGSITR